MGICARIAKRIITLLIVILGVVTLSFCLQIFTGTDPAEMLVRKTTLFATEDQIQAMRVELGLDGTLSEQYADYGQSRKGNQEKRSLSHGRIRAAFLLPIDIIRGISP